MAINALAPNFFRFFGCGLPVPEKLEGCTILDLGSGSGRDCYALSKLVGESGHVTGIDMTENLVLPMQICIHQNNLSNAYFALIILFSVDSCITEIYPAPPGEVWICKS